VRGVRKVDDAQTAELLYGTDIGHTRAGSQHYGLQQRTVCADVLDGVICARERVLFLDAT
jgi:hypothetical protein